MTGEYVVGTFFPVLGMKPAIGRLIGPEDDHGALRAAVAVVSWSYWKSRFNLDPAILGKQIVVEDVPVTWSALRRGRSPGCRSGPGRTSGCRAMTVDRQRD